MKKDYLECGKIINTHGVDGAVKLDCWCDAPEILASLKHIYFKEGENEYRAVKVKRASVFKRFVIAKLDGVEGIDAAAALKEKTVYANRNDIPLNEGANFIEDLIGLSVIDANSGKVYGKLIGVINTGASDIYEIETENGVCMMPAVDEFVKKTDCDNGIFVTPIEGMFEL